MVSTRRKKYNSQTVNINNQREKQLQEIISENVPVNVPKNGATNDDLKEIYTNVNSIPNYSAKIAEFLRTNKNHSIHRRVVKRIFPRRRLITQYPFQIFQADLIEYPGRAYTYANGGLSLIHISEPTRPY